MLVYYLGNSLLLPGPDAVPSTSGNAEHRFPSAEGRRRRDGPRSSRLSARPMRFGSPLLHAGFTSAALLACAVVVRSLRATVPCRRSRPPWRYGVKSPTRPHGRRRPCARAQSPYEEPFKSGRLARAVVTAQDVKR